jgi:phospholipase/carboxylesterase
MKIHHHSQYYEPSTLLNRVIFLHGFGADGSDLLSVAQSWKSFLPNTGFYAPNAPIPMEFGFAWYDLSSHDLARLIQGVESVSGLLREYLNAFQPQLPAVMVGFSQGASLAIQTIVHPMPTVQAAIGYGGYFASPKPVTHSFKPLLLIHGLKDEVIPMSSFHRSFETLIRLGVPLEVSVRPLLGHSMDSEGLQMGLDFIRRNLRTVSSSLIS